MDHRIKNDTELKLVLASGENEFIEFKRSVPRPETFARNIAAFSNASGGTVLFGIRDDGSVTGADPDRVQEALGRAQISLSSVPSTAVYEIPYQGKTVVAVEVERSTSGPVLSQGAALMRVGSNISPITPEGVASFLPAGDISASGLPQKIEQLAETISKQSRIIEDLRTEQVKANSWRRKLPDWFGLALLGPSSRG
jgi:hypothetical protein